MVEAFDGLLRIPARFCQNEGALDDGLNVQGKTFRRKCLCYLVLIQAASISLTSVSAWPEMLFQHACRIASLVS